MKVGDRLRDLDRRVLGRAERRLAGTGEPGSWYGGRKLRLAVGVLGIVGGVYDVVVVATGLASVAVLGGSPLMLFIGIGFTRSGLADQSGGARRR